MMRKSDPVKLFFTIGNRKLLVYRCNSFGKATPSFLFKIGRKLRLILKWLDYKLKFCLP